MKAAKTLETHEHTFIRGARANGMFIQSRQQTTSTFRHSHVDGNRGHAHPDTGPASFTIDKDDWRRATRLKGGGRKTFTVHPTGEQFPLEELEDWQQSFTVVFCDHGYTPVHASAGITRRDWTRTRDEFKRAARAKPVLPTSQRRGGAAVARMAIGFKLGVRYAYHKHQDGDV